MYIHVEPSIVDTPIKIAMSYQEALNIVHALTNLIPKDENYPYTRKLLELLSKTVYDPYFD